MSFVEILLYGYHVIERTQNSISKGNNFKNMQSRTMVLKPDTLSKLTLQVYEVSLSPMVIKLKSGHEIASQIAKGK